MFIMRLEAAASTCRFVIESSFEELLCLLRGESRQAFGCTFCPKHYKSVMQLYSEKACIRVPMGLHAEIRRRRLASIYLVLLKFATFHIHFLSRADTPRAALLGHLVHGLFLLCSPIRKHLKSLQSSSYTCAVPPKGAHEQAFTQET